MHIPAKFYQYPDHNSTQPSQEYHDYAAASPNPQSSWQQQHLQQTQAQEYQPQPQNPQQQQNSQNTQSQQQQQSSSSQGQSPQNQIIYTIHHLYTTKQSNQMKSQFLQSPLTSYSPLPMSAQMPLSTAPLSVSGNQGSTNKNSNNTLKPLSNSNNIKVDDISEGYVLKQKLKEQRLLSPSSALFQSNKIVKPSTPNKFIKPSLTPNLNLNLNANTSNISISSISSNPSSISSTPTSHHHSNKKRKQPFVNRQHELSPHVYIPSDPSINISDFTEEDIIILKNLLCSAEIHKWKYISNRLSKTRSKKLNAEYCISKFHAMYGLPFSPKNSLLHSNYFLKLHPEKMPQEENFEGMLGSSIPYILCRDGWNSIDP